MQVSELKDLLHRAAEAVEVSSLDARRVVEERADRRRRHRRAVAAAVALAATSGVLVLAVTAGHRKDPEQQVAVKAPSPTPSTAALASLPPVMRELIGSFAGGGPFISDVSEVAIKQTTWGAYVAWSASALGSTPAQPEVGNPPAPVYTAATKIYLVAQVGKVSCAAMYGCHGRTYKWDLNVVSFSAPQKGSGEIDAMPNSSLPASFFDLPGPEVVFNTRSGHVTTHTPNR